MQKDPEFNLLREEFLKKKCSIKGMIIQNRYKVLDKIGQGAFGKVFKAIDAEKKKFVALKLIDIQKIQEDIRADKIDYVKRMIESQGNIIRKCNHKNILQCYGIYANQDFKIIVTRFCENGNLEQQISKKFAFYEDQAIKVIHQIVLGLSELHSKGVVHRDLKPQNIFIHQGCYKIGDFGFAKNIPQMMNVHTDCGTPYFKAPEVNMKKPYNCKADIYSLGVIFYQMISTQKLMLERKKRANSGGWQNFKVRGREEPSKLTIDFLRKCLADQQYRMGWKQLKEHPIFYQQSKQISNNYEIPVMSLADISLSELEPYEKSLILNSDVMDSASDKEEQKITNETISSIRMSQIMGQQNMEDQVDDQDEKIYRELIQSNLCCLKANYIYLNYIIPIEKYKILDLNKRDNIQLMYLIICRCFFYLSRITNFSNKLQNKTEELKEFEQRIKDVYRTVQKTKQIYEAKLQEKQSKFFQRIKDKIRSTSEKDKFSVGLQNFDYQVREHVEYTQKILSTKISSIKCHEQEIEDKMVAHFKWYDRINMITTDQVYLQKFEKICNKILDKSRIF